ncbi:MAG: hypothetical protein CML29_06880 [Rhizobiales bacterium]|nr:hypothetical protein [Hyphomicrobiales bacterium]MBA69529.1 hypothetical protein [Hyphomicrobiales bacterium]
MQEKAIMRPETPRILLVLLPLLTGPALAQGGLPGNVPDDIVGDWDCGATRAYITGLGSLELLGENYRAGKFDADAGRMRVGWDDGGEEIWTYEVEEATRLVLTAAGGERLECTPRPQAG